MTVIKINAITVPEDAGDELAQRFAARAGAVDDQEGFEGFEVFGTEERGLGIPRLRVEPFGKTGQGHGPEKDLVKVAPGDGHASIRSDC